MIGLAELGRRLRRARRAADLSQQAAADAIGYDLQSIYRWESGRQAPPALAVGLLCRLYGVSTDEILMPSDPS